MEKESQWLPDTALKGFETRCLNFPDDYDSAVTATVIRRKTEANSTKAVLYLHGYMDYFFQSHLAEAFIEHGYNFYALDIRKYGRSLQAGQHQNYCKDIQEYFAEISEAIRIVSEEDGNDTLICNGHSTGGLTLSLYAATGEKRKHIKALILNSPFFKFNLGTSAELVMSFLAWLAPAFPFIALASNKPLPYIESLHKDYQGEWEFSLESRKLSGFPIFSGWVRAIRNAHQQVARNLSIACPVIVLHSDKSIYGASYNPSFQTGDAVLSVSHIRDGSKHLGSNVKVVEIKDGLHDLSLSRKDVREEYLKQIFSWMDSLT